MIEAMDWAGEFLTGAMRDWPEHSWNYSSGVCDPTLVNQFPPDQTANAADDAKRGRMAAHMIWELRPDEALIVEMDNHDGFWIFGMGNVFVGSMDFLYRPVSYTPGAHRGRRRRRRAPRDRARRSRRAQLARHPRLFERQPHLPQPDEPEPRPLPHPAGQAVGAARCAAPRHRDGDAGDERMEQMLDRYHSIKLRYGI